jgi:hypothetical protein
MIELAFISPVAAITNYYGFSDLNNTNLLFSSGDQKSEMGYPESK